MTDWTPFGFRMECFGYPDYPVRIEYVFLANFSLILRILKKKVRNSSNFCFILFIFLTSFKTFAIYAALENISKQKTM